MQGNAAETIARQPGPRALRERAFIQATISYANASQSVTVTVVQISATGAKLNIPDTLNLPDQFMISIPQKGIETRARLVWRKDNVAGVAFQRAQSSAANYTDVAGAEARAEALEAENGKLKAQIAEMRTQLARLTDT